MKIYTRIVINMATGETLEEEFFEYRWPIALCRAGDDDDDTGEPPGGDFGPSTADSAGAGAGKADNPDVGGSGAESGWDAFKTAARNVFQGLRADINNISPAGKFALSVVALSPTMSLYNLIKAVKDDWNKRSDMATKMSQELGISLEEAKEKINDMVNKSWDDWAKENNIPGELGEMTTEEILKSGSGESTTEGGIPKMTDFVDPNTGIPGLTKKVKKTRKIDSKNEVEAYFARSPGAEEAYQKALAANPNWGKEGGREAWARANYEHQIKEGQGIEWGPMEGTEEEYEEEEPMTLADLMKGRFDVATDTKGRLSEIEKDWDEFTTKYTGKVGEAETRYKENVVGIPKLSVKAPNQFGGASIPMAPTKHMNVYTQDLNNLLNSIGVSGGLESANLTGKENRALNLHNIGSKQYSDPIAEAFDFLKLQKQIEGQLKVTEAGKEDESIWGSLIPATGWAVGSWLGKS